MDQNARMHANVVVTFFNKRDHANIFVKKSCFIHTVMTTLYLFPQILFIHNKKYFKRDSSRFLLSGICLMDTMGATELVIQSQTAEYTDVRP